MSEPSARLSLEDTLRPDTKAGDIGQTKPDDSLLHAYTEAEVDSEYEAATFNNGDISKTIEDGDCSKEEGSTLSGATDITDPAREFLRGGESAAACNMESGSWSAKTEAFTGELTARRQQVEKRSLEDVTDLIRGIGYSEREVATFLAELESARFQSKTEAKSNIHSQFNMKDISPQTLGGFGLPWASSNGVSQSRFDSCYERGQS